MKPDNLNALIGVLTRREVEARILKPLVQALHDEFGMERVNAVLEKTIIALAEEQGTELAEIMGGNGCGQFLESLKYWTQDDALVLDILEQSETQLKFNVTRCRYAELYQDLGLAELGVMLSCNRDAVLIKGFNPEAEFKRTQTIMQGAGYCDFEYQFKDQVR